MLDLTSLLRALAESAGSDLHLIVGQPPIIRVDGELRRMPGNPIMPDDTVLVAKSIIPPDRRDLLAFQKEIDFAYTVPGLRPLRGNLFPQPRAIRLLMRRVLVWGA